MLMIASLKKHTIEADKNTECINLRFPFPKFHLVSCFAFSMQFTARAYVQGAKLKKLLIDWNEY